MRAGCGYDTRRGEEGISPRFQAPAVLSPPSSRGFYFARPVCEVAANRRIVISDALERLRLGAVEERIRFQDCPN